MNNEILLSSARLNELIRAGECTVVDCRFDLSAPGKGRADWLAGHIPGAAYAHLDNDLAAPIQSDSGRHPLPELAAFAAFLASIGWSRGRLLVAYDEGSNAIASRLWWMMRNTGQPSALLDGGLSAWTEAGLPLESGNSRFESTQPEKLISDQAQLVSADEILRCMESPELTVLDARAPERYAGTVELLDSKAGHIPGAVNRPFSDNLDSKGRFQSPDRLRAEFELLAAPGQPERVVHSCGSGVTACHNLFAMELAGLPGSRLYPGSWSEWIRDPSRPIRTGETP
ncbi:MAG: sulfurtransferase [Xanthomonadales bacterium]|nr:sulfurtransferase [Gammaproteobacteria bacterium]MBT8054662.1 sulfurtransferase [Gammaproteobacteria bacterium]NND55752.1 sulfurtransferase [Xanthomonadales bacterium]NNK50163.1 sulfurtransferase [Xanthomonadales bacterium]